MFVDGRKSFPLSSKVVSTCQVMTKRYSWVPDSKNVWTASFAATKSIFKLGQLNGAPRAPTQSAVMSVSRPARCLLSAPSIPAARPRISCRNFHTSPTLHERRKPRHASVKASDMGIYKPAKELFKGYTAEEKGALAKKYTPAQMKAIEAGEASIDINDLNERGVIRTDMGGLPYFEDFSRTRPMLDRSQKYEGPLDPSTRAMTTEEVFAREKWHLDQIMKTKPPIPSDLDPTSIEYQHLSHPNRIDTLRAEALTERYVDKNGPVPLNRIGYTMLAPGLPANIFNDNRAKSKDKEEDVVDPRDPDGIYNRLIQQTGLTLDQILAYKVKILVKHRVMNQTRLGKVSSLYCLAVAGNGDGRLGLGEAKGQEIEETQNNAKITAIRNMMPIPRYEERTIFGDVEAKVSAVEVKMSSRPPGFGLRCHHNIFEMARAAGIHDLSAKVPRSRNKMNTVKAAYQAFMTQRIPDEIARGLGKKLVDVRKVYYGGRV